MNLGTRNVVRSAAVLAGLALALACAGPAGQGAGDAAPEAAPPDAAPDAIHDAPGVPEGGRDLPSDAPDALLDGGVDATLDAGRDALGDPVGPPDPLVDASPGEAVEPEAASPDEGIPDAPAPDATAVDVGPEQVTDPWPVPDLDPEPAAPCPEVDDDPYYFQFLDDVCHAKVWPSFVDRDFACPVVDLAPEALRADGSLVSFAPASAEIVVDATALDGLDLPAGLSIVLIEIVRVAGVPHFRVVSNGTEATPLQPWSSTKFLAAANAAARLRIASDYTVGLTARVGGVPVGDYVTSIHTYDGDPYSSNSLAAWFHDVGLHSRANDLIHDLWLHRPADETFGGNYGEAPAPLPFTFVEAGGASVTLTPDPGSGPANHLSLLTLAEALKRLVLHREVALQRLPGIQWLDVKTLLYGAEGSTTYGDWGGMTADTAIYLQAGHDVGYLEARSGGRWRIFSKLGLGSQGQFVNVGYACWPVLAADGEPLPNRGREFVLAAHLASGGATWAERDRRLARAIRTILLRVVEAWL